VWPRCGVPDTDSRRQGSGSRRSTGPYGCGPNPFILWDGSADIPHTGDSSGNWWAIASLLGVQ
jgi:hypothetical protein